MPDTDNLIDLWLSVETAIPGYRAADALRDLNGEVGTRYTSSHLSRWRRGIQQPSAAAQAYMRAVVIERALYLALGDPPGTYDDDQLDQLARLLSPP